MSSVRFILWNRRWLLTAMDRAATDMVNGVPDRLRSKASSWYECPPLEPLDKTAITPELAEAIRMWTNRLSWEDTKECWPELHRHHETVMRALLNRPHVHAVVPPRPPTAAVSHLPPSKFNPFEHRRQT